MINRLQSLNLLSWLNLFAVAREGCCYGLVGAVGNLSEQLLGRKSRWRALLINSPTILQGD